MDRREFLKSTGASAIAMGTAAAPCVHGSDKSGSRNPIVGEGEYRYECHHNWGEVPDSIRWFETHNVAIDKSGLIYVKHRGGDKKPQSGEKAQDTIVVFDSDGKFVRSFGKEYHGGGHGIDIREENGQEFLYLCCMFPVNLVVKTDLKGEHLRTALTAGLRLQQQFGSNPFKYGMVAGSDTHNGLATGGEEDNFWGKFVADQPGPKRWDHVMFTDKAGYRRLGWTQVGAGVTGVWATANTREALWDAMQRRETYASSGPRISVRFFAGYDFSNQDAEPASLVASGYARGVPMGGDLQAAPAGKAPTFLFAALKDPQGANLDAAQIIKGWVDARGESHERIFNVAWSEQGTRKEVDGRLPPVGNTVDLATATYQNSIGATELVGSFTDPQFDPAQRAYYYLRAVEIPTPRWTAYDSVRYKVQMTPDVPMTEQERVVTSPIWYNPG